MGRIRCTLPSFHRNDVADKLIIDYWTLDIDVVSMVLQDHHLPQIELVRNIYRSLIKGVHPDKTRTDTTSQASAINDAYARIKAMMKDPDAQFELIRPILQFYQNGVYPGKPYVILFIWGGFIALLLINNF
jgi:hypothetical protein